jgi:hypothetical protein
MESMRQGKVGRWPILPLAAAGLVLGALACGDSNSPVNERSASQGSRMASSVRAQDAAVDIEVFAPENGDVVGVDGIGWFVDLALEFEGDIASTGFTGNQLTGPGVHENAPPFPGTFTPGKDDRFGGLIVLFTTTSFGAGSCQNLANLFNLTGPTNVLEDETEIWDTWIISAPLFGVHTRSTMFVAEAADLDHDGIHNDAPDVVEDSNHDNICNEADLKAVGLDSRVAEKQFFIN